VSDGWLGFLGGVLATLVGAFIASVSQRHVERKRRQEQAQLDVYFLLLDLQNWYFWVAAAELRGDHPSEQALAESRRLTYQLNDKLRTFEDVAHLEEILTVLFSESIPSANERARKLDHLLDQYSHLVNPKYRIISQRIGQENLLRYGPGKAPASNAPGSWQYRK
jgi:hypothetical protein